MAQQQHVAFRLDDDTVAQVDVIAAHISQPWHEATRSDALRAIVQRGIVAWSADLPELVPVVVVHADAPRALRPGRSELVRRRKARTVEADVALKAEAEAALDRILKGSGI